MTKEKKKQKLFVDEYEVYGISARRNIEHYWMNAKEYCLIQKEVKSIFVSVTLLLSILI